MVRKFVVLALACAVSLSLLCACGRGKVTPEGPMKVTASIAPIAALVEAIGGDSVDVQVLLHQGADAERFEPQIGKLREL
ncbi:MAG: zinc ABC transporter substrate-binding protein [Muribaculaceae bacterium]|nr:zinc ABC transporter substrate-binding protein [Muribaculaceae bacterium]